MTKLAIAAAIAALALSLSAAPPAHAQQFTPPKGCEAFVTVQNRACTVSLLWRCNVSPEGDIWEATFSPDGLDSVVSYDHDYQWLDAAYSWDRSREEFDPPATDPISLGDLLETGSDTYDFLMRRSTPDRRYQIRVTGADMLTGATVTIDGFLLDEVETRLEIVDDEGVTEYASQGTQFFSRDLGLFFLGPEKVLRPGGETSQYNDSPVDIILPGEPGFGATEPLYDCVLQEAHLRFAVPGRPSAEAS